MTGAASSRVAALPATTFNVSASNVSIPKTPTATFEWDSAKQGLFVTAVARQSSGDLWVGTEDSGVWKFDARSAKWTQWLAQPALSQIDAPSQTDQYGRIVGLGDSNAYALAIDGKGRVWAAQRNHGVAVWNGEDWRFYGAENGPLGERVFDIKVCARDGAVWMATSCGLARYSVQKDSWRYFTRTDGLPSDQIQTLAFDKVGNIVVGTQCDGIAMANLADNYLKWRVVAGAPTAGDTPTGKGLPSNQINDVLVARDNTIYVATNCGLAWSRDKGQSWIYARGRDYADKVRGRALGLPYARWKETAGATLSEDYITCLAEDAQGLLWIGHRAQPYEVFDPKTQGRVWSGEKDFQNPTSSTRSGAKTALDNYVTRILPMPDGAPLVARYGDGLTRSAMPVEMSNVSTVPAPPSSISSTRKPTETLAFPSAAKASNEAELAAMLKRVRALTAQKPTTTPKPTTKGAIVDAPSAIYLNDDWTTIGDWIGRYGRQKALLWAINAPYSQPYGTDPYKYVVQARIGINHEKGDALRHWIHWAKSDNPNVLYSSQEGGRSEAEIDDHGEEYPQGHEGPDIWKYVEVPRGAQRMSLYFFNKDGHDGMNRYRDYLVEIRACSADPEKLRKDRYWSPAWVPIGMRDEQYSEYQIKLASRQPVLSSTRIRDFWGGVYKSFAVSGGQKYWVRIAKNGSFNTICQAIFFDRMRLPLNDKDGDWDKMTEVNLGDIYPDDPSVGIWYLIEKDAKGRPMRRLDYSWGGDLKPYEPKTMRDPRIPPRLRLALELWKALDDASESPAVAPLQRRARLMAYRVLYDADKNRPTTWGAGEAPKYNFYPSVALKNWRWHLGIWSDVASEDRKAWRDAVRAARVKYEEMNKDNWANQTVEYGTPKSQK